MTFGETDVVGRLSVTVPADNLDAALQMCRLLITAFTVVAMEIEPEAPSNSRRGFYAHLLIVSPTTDGVGEEAALRQAAVPVLAHFGAERKQIHIGGRSDGRLVADVSPRRPVGQDPHGVLMCRLSLMLGVDPFDRYQDLAAPEALAPAVALAEDEAQELLSWVQAGTAVRVAIVADVVGADAIDARDMVREFTGSIGRQILGPSTTVEVDEPEILEDESIRVAVLVGPTELEPSEAVATFAAAIGPSGWSAPTVKEYEAGPHVFLEWRAEDLPARGISRLEVHATRGLTPVPGGELPDRT